MPPIHNTTRPPFGAEFHDAAPYGREAERRFACWAMRQGLWVHALSRLDDSRAPAPLLRLDDGASLPMPDFVVARDGAATFVEVKRRRAPSLHRVSGTWLTGIESEALDDYCGFAHVVGLPVILILEHDERIEGYLGGEVRELRDVLHHRHSGMAYWRLCDLRPIRNAADLGFGDADDAAEGGFEPADPHSDGPPDFRGVR